MNLVSFGAAQTVTGSRHMLSINGYRLLLDCGFYQGRRKDTYEQNLNFPFNPKTVDAVLLSHAHIDHSANLPNLVKQGFEGRIHTTAATAHLADIMLRDTAHILEYDVEYLNKKRKKRGEPPVEPIYTMEDAERAGWHFSSHAYNAPFEVVPGVTAELVDAGHILGSAGIVLDIDDKGKHSRVMFSGDIGRRDMPILRDPVLPKDVDTLIMECTYGDRLHEDPEQAYEALRTVLNRTIQSGGKIIIPAFAVGRTQTLVYYIHQMFLREEIPEVPVYVDSPLAINVTDIFRQHTECYDQEIFDFMRKEVHGGAFGFHLLSYTRTVEESKAINKSDEPAIIISASGMAEAGRILHHLKNNIEEERNTILITSWVAPHTLARRLLEGNKTVRIFGEEYPVRADVVEINGFSAHADQAFLIEYAKAAGDRLKKIVLVHGEEDAAKALMDKMKEAGLPEVIYPGQGERVELPLP
ncbi:MAG: MBL fold metallo-hydrolase [Anaerolineales bacterium]|nr:MBL fold metallo-hydrolase [Anaerolineales bacterium]